MLLIPGNVLLALGSAVLWGGGDFSGGMSVAAAGGKTPAALRVVLLSHASSLTVLAVILVLRGEPLPHGALLAWSLLAGFSGGVSLTCFYMALARGAMGASAAVSGLLAAAVPALIALKLEGAPSPLRVSGFIVAAAAIWMIAAGPAAQRARHTTMVLAIVAGLGFGVYFTSLRMANPLGVWMPMAVARVGSIFTCGATLVFVTLFAKRQGNNVAWKLSRRAVLLALGAGALDTSGNLLFIAATRAGRLDVAAVLASLYPASTIVLAGWLLKERVTRRQGLGMCVAAAAVVMITL